MNAQEFIQWLETRKREAEADAEKYPETLPRIHWYHTGEAEVLEEVILKFRELAGSAPLIAQRLEDDDIPTTGTHQNDAITD